MPQCIVKGCSSGSRKCRKSGVKVHLFSVPKDLALRDKWQNAVRRTDIYLNPNKHAVCNKHFLKSEIKWFTELKDSAGNVLGVSGKTSVPRLQTGTVPSIFEWNQSQKIHNNFEVKDQHVDPIDMDVSETTSNVSEENTILQTDMLLPADTINADIQRNLTRITLTTIIKSGIELPKHWIMHKSVLDGVTVLCFLMLTGVKTPHGEFCFNASREVILSENDNGDISYQINVAGCPLKKNTTDFYKTGQRVVTISDVENLLEKVHSIGVCRGCAITIPSNLIDMQTSFRDKMGNWRHNQCPLVSETKTCSFCIRMRKSIRNRHFRLNNQQKVKRLRLHVTLKERDEIQRQRKLKKSRMMGKQKALKAIAEWRFALREAEKEIMNISMKKVYELLINDKISDKDCIIIKRIVSTAMYPNKNGRYSEEWLLLCMLLQVESYEVFKFLKQYNVLPLPNVRAIKSYLNIIDTNYEFQVNFLQLLERFLHGKPKLVRHGALLFDKVPTQENYLVKKKELLHQGIIDFGDENINSGCFNAHGMVIKFKSFVSSNVQPVAVFAYREPISADKLLKLIQKAIVQVENAGGYVHALIADGTETNMDLWKKLGISGKQVTDKNSKPMFTNIRNFFPHPKIGERKVYVFSDTPHLMTSIRNRLYNNYRFQMDPHQPAVQWYHFCAFYVADKKACIRICPKVNEDHLVLKKSDKQRVKLAVQVFSKTMAKSLRHYRNTGLDSLKDCESSAQFCEWMNEVFDALNLQSNVTGMKVDCPQFMVLEDSLQILDTWEENASSNEIPAKFFLSPQTAEEFRVTLQSTLDLTRMLIKDYGFSEVYTGNINQEDLKVKIVSLKDDENFPEHNYTLIHVPHS